MKKTLTEIQDKVLNNIIEFVEEKGFPPTIREIMSLMGYASVNNVQRILNVLENKGFIRRNRRGGARCIEVLHAQNNSWGKNKKLPIIGTVAAGSPIFAEQNIEGYFTLDPHVMGFDADFVLKVKGNSMKDAFINQDDLIIVRKTNFPENNDIIIALLDNEATVKRFFIENDLIRLQPENPDYLPIEIKKNDLYFKILGRVEAVIHKL